MTNRPIGIFDSGVGGLTVLAKVRELLPNENVIYVGDTANVPYGGKDYETLLGYGRGIINFLRGHDVKAVVLACGTTSSTVYEELAREYPDIPLIDVIRPGVKACIELERNDGLRIGLIATAATIKSGLFKRLLLAECPDISLVERACPLFAPMVEVGVIHGPIAEWVARTYLENWYGKIDALVLGCTHYPLLTDAIFSVLEDVKLVNLAAYAAENLKFLLAAEGMLNGTSTPGTCKYYVSGETSAFDKSASFLLGDIAGAMKMM